MKNPASARKPKRTPNKISKVNKLVAELPKCRVQLENITLAKVAEINRALKVKATKNKIKSREQEKDKINDGILMDGASKCIGTVSELSVCCRQECIEIEIPSVVGEPKIKYILSKEVMMKLCAVFSLLCVSAMPNRQEVAETAEIHDESIIENADWQALPKSAIQAMKQMMMIVIQVNGIRQCHPTYSTKI